MLVFNSLALILVLVSSILALPKPMALAQNDLPPDLFVPAAPPPGYELPDLHYVVRSHFVTVDMGLLAPETPMLTLNLFPDTIYVAERQDLSLIHI